MQGEWLKLLQALHPRYGTKVQPLTMSADGPKCRRCPHRRNPTAAHCAGEGAGGKEYWRGGEQDAQALWQISGSMLAQLAQGAAGVDADQLFGRLVGQRQ